MRVGCPGLIRIAFRIQGLVGRPVGEARHIGRRGLLEREAVAVVRRVLRRTGRIKAGIGRIGALHYLDADQAVVDRTETLLHRRIGADILRSPLHSRKHLGAHFGRDAVSLENRLGTVGHDVGELDAVQGAVAVIDGLQLSLIGLMVFQRRIVLAIEQTLVARQEPLALRPALMGVPQLVLALRLVTRRSIVGHELARGGNPRLLQVQARLGPQKRRLRAPNSSVALSVRRTRAQGARLGNEGIVVAHEAVFLVAVLRLVVGRDHPHVRRQAQSHLGHAATALGPRSIAHRLMGIARGNVLVHEVRTAVAVGALQATVDPTIHRVLMRAVLVGLLMAAAVLPSDDVVALRRGGRAGQVRVGAVEHLPQVAPAGLVGGKGRVVMEVVHVHQHVLVLNLIEARGIGIGVAERPRGVLAQGVRAARRPAGVVLADAREVPGLQARGAGEASGVHLNGGVHLGQPVQSGGYVEDKLDGIAHLDAGVAHRRLVGGRQRVAGAGHHGHAAREVSIGNPLDAEQGEARRRARGARIQILEDPRCRRSSQRLRGVAVGHHAAEVTGHLGRIGLVHAGHLQVHLLVGRALGQHIGVARIGPANSARTVEPLLQVLRGNLVAVVVHEIVQRNALVEHRIVDLALDAGAAQIGLGAPRHVVQSVFVPDALAGQIALLLVGIRIVGLTGQLLALERLSLEAHHRHTAIGGELGLGIGVLLGHDQAVLSGLLQLEPAALPRGQVVAEIEVRGFLVVVRVAHIEGELAALPRLGRLLERAQAVERRQLIALIQIASDANQGHIFQRIGRGLTGTVHGRRCGHIVIGPAHLRHRAEGVDVHQVARLDVPLVVGKDLCLALPTAHRGVGARRIEVLDADGGTTVRIGAQAIGGGGSRPGSQVLARRHGGRIAQVNGLPLLLAHGGVAGGNLGRLGQLEALLQVLVVEVHRYRDIGGVVGGVDKVRYRHLSRVAVHIGRPAGRGPRELDGHLRIFTMVAVGRRRSAVGVGHRAHPRGIVGMVVVGKI